MLCLADSKTLPRGMESVFLGQRLDWKSEGLGTHQRAVQLHDYTGPEPNYTEASLSTCALHVYAFKLQRRKWKQ